MGCAKYPLGDRKFHPSLSRPVAGRTAESMNRDNDVEPPRNNMLIAIVLSDPIADRESACALLLLYQRPRRLTQVGDSLAPDFLTPWGGRIRVMPSAIRLREDYLAEELRGLARRSKNVNQSRRLLSLAAVLSGMDRGGAAKIGGMDRQTLRDWIHRLNASGPEGLFDNWTEGPKLACQRRIWPSSRRSWKLAPIVRSTASCLAAHRPQARHR
jgi:hypothetical protein